MPKKKMWKKVFEVVRDHPWRVAAGVGIPYLGFQAITGTADKVHSTYDIMSQHGQKKVLEEQRELLKKIHDSIGKSNDVSSTTIDTLPKEGRSGVFFKKKEQRYY